MTHEHTLYDAGPRLSPQIAQKVCEIVKNGQEMYVSQLKESPPTTFDEAFPLKPTVERSVSDQEKNQLQQKETACYRILNHKGIGNKDSTRSRLRRL